MWQDSVFHYIKITSWGFMGRVSTEGLVRWAKNFRNPSLPHHSNIGLRGVESKSNCRSGIHTHFTHSHPLQVCRGEKVGRVWTPLSLPSSLFSPQQWLSENVLSGSIITFKWLSRLLLLYDGRLVVQPQCEQFCPPTWLKDSLYELLCFWP